MKLFLINLDRRPDRLRRMTEIFDRLGLEFERIAAVDGTKLPAEEIWPNSHLRPGETGCFLSHRECWRRVIDEALPYAAIFEDDLHLAPDAAALLGSGDWVPAEADVVKLETRLYPARIEKAVAGSVGGRTLHRLRSRHAGAGGYIVTRKGAEKLFAMSERLDAPVDQFIFNPELRSATLLTTLQLLPAVCVQDFHIRKRSMVLGLGSDLHDERSSVKPKGISKLWREVKRPALQLSGLAQRSVSTLLTDKKWVLVKFS